MSGPIDHDATQPPVAAPPGYEVLGELGRGGMGVVYKARPGIVQVHEIGEQAGLRASPVASAPGGGRDESLGASPGADATGLAACIPKITDFGPARKLDEQGQTPTGSIPGTPAYMAPEQASGSKAVGPAHPSPVFAVAFSPDGKQLATAGGVYFVWQTTFSDDGAFLVGATREGKVRAWPRPPGTRCRSPGSSAPT